MKGRSSVSQELDNGRSDVAIGLACGVAGFLNDNPGNATGSSEQERETARGSLASIVSVAVNATVLERGVVQVRLERRYFHPRTRSPFLRAFFPAQ
jgi:hypothetical protein